MSNTLLICVLLGVSTNVRAADYRFEGDISLSNTNYYMPHASGLDNLNGNFRLSVSARAINDAYPRSYCPLYFTRNPQTETMQGFSIGHGISKTRLELRMSDGTALSKLGFGYKKPLDIVQENYFEITCMVTEKGRICSVLVNGEATVPASMLFPITGNIYGGNGALFGDIWGWRFIGVFHGVAVEAPQAGCYHYGNQVVADPSKVVHSSNNAVDFRCATTTSTSTQTTTTSSTRTTNTIAQAVDRFHDHIGDLFNSSDSIVQVVSELQAELVQSQAASKALEDRLQTQETQMAQLINQLSSLQGMVSNLALTPTGGAPSTSCNGVDLDTVQPPSISTAADGLSLDVAACQGRITFSSKECVVDPCKTQQDLAEVQAKLATLKDMGN
eukprot:m.260521 g.260521  ORF g.260521 m.260521 type:complete len:387 (+) comp40031_c0_seq1:144-1304(+)